MDVPEEGRLGGSRRRRRTGGKRKTRVAEEPTIVTKDEAVPASAAAGPKPPVATVAAAKPQKIVIAPAKKKPAKVMLVPKSKPTVRQAPAKTFKAKHVKVTIDNTAKTQKRRRSVVESVDAMTDDKIRAAAVQARLSRRETVAKAPIALLRQMVKDYQTMKGMLL